MRIDPVVVRRLHARASGERWRVSPESFAQALSTSADRSFSGKPTSTEDVERYLNGLHLEDLALACACLEGNDDAWEHLVREYRPLLDRAAASLDPAGRAREIADALYGELYGAPGKDGERRPLLRYFHGRSSLATWLRAVLSQRFVDRIRVTTREQVLPDDDSPQGVPAPEQPPADPERDRYLATIRAALGAAVAALDPRDRLRLGCYYAQDLTLAETGKILHEHEATASRQLARTRQAIRADVERRLRDEARLTDEGIAECFASVAADAGPLDLRELIGPPGLGDADVCRKKTGAGRSKKEHKL